MSEATWQGYVRADGRIGIRNVVLVVYTVQCAQFVAHAVAQGEPDTHVIGFPGCYDNEYAIRLMLALARHPNVGAVLAIGLGCEYTQPARIADAVRASRRPAEAFFIQEHGGTAESIAYGKRLLAQLRSQSASAPRGAMSWSDLTVGCECGGSDATSGLAGNPVVGRLYDWLVDHGATAIFEETVEMIGLRDVLSRRAATTQARSEIETAYDKAECYCRAVRQYSISPGNFAGGLTTIEEKSLGAVSKSGSRNIEGVIRVAEQPPHAGLWLMDSVPDQTFMQFGYTNPNDTEGIMDLISAGSQIVLFVTGRGSVIGSPIAPLVKVTGNSETFARMHGDIDFNAGSVLDGSKTLDEAAGSLAAFIATIAAGAPTKPESLGHREYFIMYKHQTISSPEQGCRA
jgi:altronate dehydratase large subunit